MQRLTLTPKDIKDLAELGFVALIYSMKETQELHAIAGRLTAQRWLDDDDLARVDALIKAAINREKTRAGE